MKKIILALFLALILILFGTAIDARRLPSHNRVGPLNRAKYGTLIVGGRPALQGELPYQLSLKVNGNHFCGGSLVEVDGLQIGITAAHCIYDTDADYYDVVAGDINFADNTGIEQKIHVNSVVVHPNWDKETQNNDIAILFLNGSYVLNTNINTIRLPSPQQITQGKLTVSGWGDLSYSEPAPDELQIVRIPVVDDATCQKAYEDFYYQVSDDMICTVAPAGDLNPCNGDNGGPAATGDNDVYLAGIVSWGYDCGNKDYPAVYTKVSHYIDFIESSVANYKKSL